MIRRGTGEKSILQNTKEKLSHSESIRAVAALVLWNRDQKH